MKITQISYAKTIESNVLGAGVWVKIGITGDVTENENIDLAIEQAKEVVDTAHKKELASRPVPQGDIYFNVSKNKTEY